MERLANLILAINIYAWGILGILDTEPACRWTVVRISTSLLHAVVATLVLFRRPALRNGKLTESLCCLPSMLICGMAFSLAERPDRWPLFAELLFLAGTSLAVVSLLALGKNFAIFPSARSISQGGPYAWVRHPVYAGELVMILACVVAAASGLAWLVFTVALPMLALRIWMEERLLQADPVYQTYRQNVRYRMVPGVW